MTILEECDVVFIKVISASGYGLGVKYSGLSIVMDSEAVRPHYHYVFTG